MSHVLGAPLGDRQSDRELISLIIELYRGNPVLWKVNHKDYFNKQKKSAAWEKILEAVNVFRPDYKVDDLKRRINVLRSNFNREFKLIEEQKVSGVSTDDIPAPSLWYYNELLFIKDQIQVATTEISEPPLSDNLRSSSVSQPAPLTPKPPLKKKKGNQDVTDHLVRLATEYFKRPDTEEDILAKGWALKLTRMDTNQRRFAERIITDVLFDGDMGTLSWEGVRFVTSQRPWSQPPTSSAIPSAHTTISSPSSPGPSSTMSSGSQSQIGQPSDVTE